MLKQLKLLSPLLLKVYLPTSLIFIAARLQTKVDFALLIDDVSSITNSSWYVGFFQNIGILLFCSSAAILLFTSLVIRVKNRELFLFFLYSGILTTHLVLDDLFRFHETIYPYYFKIPEFITFVAYAALLAFISLRFRKIIIKTEYIFLLLVVVFYGFSILVDLLPHGFLILQGVLEELPKLLGTISLFIYFSRVCMNKIRFYLMA